MKCFLPSCWVIPRSITVDVLKFGTYISTATAALAASSANGKQCRRVMDAMLERQAPHTQERPCIKGYPGGNSQKNCGSKLQNNLLNFRGVRWRNTICPKEPAVNAKKKVFPLQFFWIDWNITSYKTKNLWYMSFCKSDVLPLGVFFKLTQFCAFSW